MEGLFGTVFIALVFFQEFHVFQTTEVNTIYLIMGKIFADLLKI